MQECEAALICQPCLDFAQILMDKLYRDRALSYAGSDPFNGPMPHVTDGKNSGDVSFQQKWITLEIPALRSLAIMNKIRSCKYESPVIALNYTAEPVRSGQSPNEDKHGRSGNALDLVRVGAEYGDFFQMFIPVGFDYGGMRPYLNVWHFFNLINQILGHGAGERASTDQNDHTFCIAGEVHGCLTSRVCSPNHINDFAFAGKRFGCPTAVIDAGALQFIHANCIQTPPLNSCRDHERMTGDFTAVCEFNDAIGPFNTKTESFLRGKNLHIKTPRLNNRAPGQIAATKAGRKPKIVFDARTHASLTTRSFAFDHDGMQAFRSAIDRSRESGRASTNDRQIVKVGFGARAQPDFLRDVRWKAFQKLCSVREQHNGQIGSLRAEYF